ncbi:MAG: outer membrane lipoprotein chaperone LolA [Myxococcota bacterium]|jgi:outer membrane lipoprotein carrier protein
MMNKKILLAAVAAMAAFMLMAAAAPDGDNLDRILTRLQKIYDHSTGFTAVFEQTYRSAHGGMKSDSFGQIWFKKPGKVRWEYDRPRKKIFVASGENLWIYTPEDNQVMTSKKFSQSQLTLALAFLYGTGRIVDNFDVTIQKKFDTGWTLRMVPKKEQGQIAALLMDVSNASYLVTALEVEDSLGNRNRFVFLKTSLNAATPDSMFTFTPPEDVEVVPVPEGFVR